MKLEDNGDLRKCKPSRSCLHQLTQHGRARETSYQQKQSPLNNKTNKKALIISGCVFFGSPWCNTTDYKMQSYRALWWLHPTTVMWLDPYVLSNHVWLKDAWQQVRKPSVFHIPVNTGWSIATATEPVSNWNWTKSSIVCGNTRPWFGELR